MGRKAGKYKKKEELSNSGSGQRSVKGKATSRRFHSKEDDDDMMHDQIDAFHKQRDVVPLDINDDLEEDSDDEDNELSVFDLEDDKDEDEDDEDDSIEDDEDDDDDEDVNEKDHKQPKGIAALVRTQKYLRSKFGGAEDELLSDQEEEEQQPRIWKNLQGADVDNEVLSGDEENMEQEEQGVRTLQIEKAKGLSLDDFGYEDTIEKIEREPTFKEMTDAGKLTVKASPHELIKDDQNIAYEVVKKDLSSLTKEEQMNVVYSSAPELVGLLAELNDALEQLQDKVNPLLNKVKGRESAKKGGMHFLEVKQLLLQSFCQAITFYLLLKSEGHSVRDHPVVSRLVEIKSLLDKIKEMDDNLPFDSEEILKRDPNDASVVKFGEGTAALESDSMTHGGNASLSAEVHPSIEPKKAAELSRLRSSKTNESECKLQVKHVRPQTTEMLNYRAALEEKLKQTGVLSSIAPQNVRVRKNPQPMNRQLETLDDFDDEVMEVNNDSRGSSNGHSLNPKKRKVISGDDDIPKRDDIGERRWKHQLRVLAGAGIKSVDDADINANVDDEDGNLLSDANGESDTDSASEYYEQAERRHTEKMAVKENQYSRTPEVSSLAEATVDGKRLITYQIEKNRGLTRRRNKTAKNARKKYRNKYISAETRRKGQVRAIRKPTGPYGGEASGINPRTSRSIRFNS